MAKMAKMAGGWETEMPKVTEATALAGLTPKERQAVKAYINGLIEALPGQIVRIILYGSKARGEGTPESDIDLMIVIRNGEKRRPDGFWTSLISDPRWKTIVDIANDILLDYEVFISPFAIGEERFEHGSLLIKDVQREGIQLWHRPKR